MSVDKNIQRLLDNASHDADVNMLLTLAQKRVLASEEAGNYTEGVHDYPIVAFNDEGIQQSYLELHMLFDFVETFTVAEYLAFAEEYQKLRAAKTKRPRGRPKKTEDDAAKQIIKDVETIIKCFKGLRKNMLTAKLEYLRQDKDKEEWVLVQGSDIQEISIDIAYYHGIHVPKERASQAFSWAARKNPYYPTAALMDRAREAYPDLSYEDAREFLSGMGSYLCGSIEDEPTIDGQSLRDRFMARYFIAVAYNARNPGKTVQWMPILIGAQGCGKSLLARHLVPEDSGLFHEVVGSMDLLLRETQRLHNGMILELPEINEYFQRKHAVDQLKQLVTKQSDNVRFPYDRDTTDLERTFAFIGTANVYDLFTDGSDEGERRYLPISIPEGFKTPWQELRDGLNLKIWAAADIIASCFSPTSKYSDRFFGFDDEERVILYKWQKNYTANDPWEAAVFAYISPRKEFTPSEVLQHALGIMPCNQSTADVARLRKLLKQKFAPRLKYTAQARRNGKRIAIWSWVDQPPLEDQFNDAHAMALSDVDTPTNF